MKKTKKLFMMLLVCLLVNMAVMPISASAAKLNKKRITLNVGKTYTLKTAGIKRKITWSSNKKSIATVSSKGVVKAVKKGTAVVTAKYGKKKLTCKVTVKQPVTSIKLNKTSVTLKKGNKLTLKATVYPKNANNRAVVWKSSNKKVATVSSKGVVKAVGNGTATITVTAKDGSKKKASCKVNIGKTESQKKRLITKIEFGLNEREMWIYPDYAKDYDEQNGVFINWPDSSNPLVYASDFSKPWISPSNASNKNLLWKSSNKKVAVVDSNGNVTAKSIGTATIIASATDGSGKSASYKLQVNGGKENFMVVDMTKSENVEKYIRKSNRTYVETITDDWSGETKKQVAYFLYENPLYNQGWRFIGTAKKGSDKFAMKIEIGEPFELGMWSSNNPYTAITYSKVYKPNIMTRGKMLFYNIRGGGKFLHEDERYKANPY